MKPLDPDLILFLCPLFEGSPSQGGFANRTCTHRCDLLLAHFFSSSILKEVDTQSYYWFLLIISSSCSDELITEPLPHSRRSHTSTITAGRTGGSPGWITSGEPSFLYTSCWSLPQQPVPYPVFMFTFKSLCHITSSTKFLLLPFGVRVIVFFQNCLFKIPSYYFFFVVKSPVGKVFHKTENSWETLTIFSIHDYLDGHIL